MSFYGRSTRFAMSDAFSLPCICRDSSKLWMSLGTHGILCLSAGYLLTVLERAPHYNFAYLEILGARILVLLLVVCPDSEYTAWYTLNFIGSDCGAYLLGWP